MKHTFTYSYSVLEITSQSWDDIAARLKRVGEDQQYIDWDNGLIILGQVALIKEKHG